MIFVIPYHIKHTPGNDREQTTPSSTIMDVFTTPTSSPPSSPVCPGAPKRPLRLSLQVPSQDARATPPLGCGIRPPGWKPSFDEDEEALQTRADLLVGLMICVINGIRLPGDLEPVYKSMFHQVFDETMDDDPCGRTNSAQRACLGTSRRTAEVLAQKHPGTADNYETLIRASLEDINLPDGWRDVLVEETDQMMGSNSRGDDVPRRTDSRQRAGRNAYQPTAMRIARHQLFGEPL